MQKALRNVIQIFQIEISRPKLNFKSYKKQIEEYDGFADTMSTSASEAAPAPAVLEEDQVEEVFRVEGAEEEDVDMIIDHLPRVHPTPVRVYCPRGRGGENQGEDHPRED